MRYSEACEPGPLCTDDFSRCSSDRLTIATAMSPLIRIESRSVRKSPMLCLKNKLAASWSTNGTLCAETTGRPSHQLHQLQPLLSAVKLSFQASGPWVAHGGGAARIGVALEAEITEPHPKLRLQIPLLKHCLGGCQHT